MPEQPLRGGTPRPAGRSGQAALQDDYSGNFQPLRQRLMAESRGEYLRFLDGLTPRYGRTWLSVLLGYGFLALVVFLAGRPAAGAGQIVAALLGAIAVGYGIAFLQLFLHEAAHYQLARDRRLNDRLCDALISWQAGTSIGRYRPIHFAHHRHLGTTADTENSYFRPLNVRLIVETLTGIHALRILLNRNHRLARLPASDAGAAPQVVPALRGVLLHALACAGAYAWSGWPGLAAWVLGVGSFFPLFATIRQLLEHRAPDADPATDYALRNHGAMTRMFGRGPVASTLGGAGFNRHLLHHWEPQVPCTRLAELERYLAGTSAAPIMAARRSTYAGTLAAAWRGAAQRA